jgi:hypothetical protein
MNGSTWIARFESPGHQNKSHLPRLRYLQELIVACDDRNEAWPEEVLVALRDLPNGQSSSGAGVATSV